MFRKHFDLVSFKENAKDFLGKIYDKHSSHQRKLKDLNKQIVSIEHYEEEIKEFISNKKLLEEKTTKTNNKVKRTINQNNSQNNTNNNMNSNSIQKNENNNSNRKLSISVNKNYVNNNSLNLNNLSSNRINANNVNINNIL